MGTLRKTLSAGVAATLLFVGLTVNSRGEIGGGLSFGPSSERAVQIRGNVVCTGCSLEEARQARPRDNTLYQLTHSQGRLVLQVHWVSNAARWGRIVWPPQLRVRGEAGLLQQLGAEENLFKDIEVSGLLSSLRTLDLLTINVKG